MKNLLAFVLMCFVSLMTANAQYDPKALSILDKVSEKYEKLNSFKVEFEQTLNNDDMGELANIKGEVISKGNQFHLKLNNEEIISDGKTVWTYSPADKQVIINKAEVVLKDFYLNPSEIHNIYRKGFKYKYVGERTANGKANHVIDLEPEKPLKSNISKIQLLINKQDMTFTGFTVFAEDGNRYIVDIKGFKPNIAVADGAFTFNKSKFPGVTELDMRDF